MALAAVLLVLGLGPGCERDAPAPPPKLEVVAAPAMDDPVPWIRAQVAERRDRQVLVYMGATWCEPCTRFHDAVIAGQLDAMFPRLTLLEFDQDRDGDGLLRAGYTSEYIPLFVWPAPDGTASRAWIEGSVKGEEAMADLVPRLRALLARPPTRAPAATR
jgi:hypothetical protein